MREEKIVPSSERYLIGTGIVENQLVKKLSLSIELLSKMRSDKIYMQSLSLFSKRIISEKEIAIFTTYAYADFPIHKKYDIIFDLNNPDNFVELSFILKHALLHMGSFYYFNSKIEHGHKHICILEFEDKTPSIIKELTDIVEVERNRNVEYKKMCFCQKCDFAEIRENLKSKNVR